MVGEWACHCHAPPPQSNICKQVWSLPEWSPLWGLHSNGRLLVLLAYQIGWKWMAVSNTLANEGKSAASSRHQVAALLPYMFHSFYSVKNCRNAKNSTSLRKNKHKFGILWILEFFHVCLTKFKKQSNFT
jgi:hypothetical protein